MDQHTEVMAGESAGNPDTKAILHRRGLMRTVASGFGLAASGLVLPAWLVAEKAAASHPAQGVQGRKHQRRSKHRHQRKRRRDDRRHKNDRHDDHGGRGSGKFGFRDTALTIKNETDKNGRQLPLDCTFYYRQKIGFDSYGKLVQAKQEVVLPGTSLRFSPDRFLVAVLIKYPAGPGEDVPCIYIEARNIASIAFPRAFVNLGFNLQPLNGGIGGPLIAEQGYGVDERLWKIGPPANTEFSIKREADTDFIEFSVTQTGLA